MSEAHDYWARESLDDGQLAAMAVSEDVFERWAAAFELGESASPAAHDTLKKLLGDDDSDVRDAAASALRKLGVSVHAHPRADAAAQSARRVRTHLDAQPYVAWKIKRLPTPRKDNHWVVEASLLDIIQTEGPLTGGRLFRLYSAGVKMDDGGWASHQKLHAPLRSLINQGRVVRADDFRSENPESWTLHERGGQDVAIRQRGLRELRDIPVEEVRAAVRASTIRLGNRALDRDRAFEAIINFYDAGRELDVVGKLLAAEWAPLLG